MSLNRTIVIFAFIVICLFSVSAKETVIYENDFSDTSLDSFQTDDAWYVSNGELSL